MKSRLNTMVAGLALTVPFLVPAIGTAEVSEPVVYVSSTTSGNVDGVWFADEDILAYGTSSDTWERYFDGSDVGLRHNDVNAFHIADDGAILMALKKPQRVGGFWADDSDVIAFSPTSLGKHTAGTFEKVFDGSDVGLSTWAEQIDALAMTPDGRLLLSTSGSLKVPRTGGGTLWSADEDLIVFNAESFGTSTVGSFERYFDGSDVGLRNSSEDVWGAWVDPHTGEIVMTTKADYRVPGLSGDKEDVIVFAPDSLGYQTTGTFFPGWDGDDHGLSGEYLDGLSVELPSDPQEQPQFQASLTNDWVQGWGYVPGVTVSVRVFDFFGPGNEELFSGDTPVDGDGYFFVGDLGIDLMPDMYIEVDDRALELEDLSFDVFDVDGDRIGGMAPAGALVEFGVGNGIDDGRGGQTTADGSRSWQVDLNTAEFDFFDLDNDMGGQAWISDDDGDQTVAEPPQPPQFQASLTNNWVQGRSFTPGANVLVEIFDFAGPGNTQVFNGSPIADGDGNFHIGDLREEGVELRPGMYITVTDPTLPVRELVLVDLTFTTFDVVGEVIGGAAAEGTVVEFGVGNEGSDTGGQTTAVAGDAWSVDLSADPYHFDLTEETGGQAWVSDADGDQTVAEPPPPPPPTQFQASLTNDWVQGWNFTPGASVILKILATEGGAELLSTTVVAGGDGYFNLDDLESVDLLPEMFITVDDGTLDPRSLVLADLTFEVFDVGAEMIGGAAVEGSVVGFGVGNDDGGRDGQTDAVAGDTWSVDLSAAPYNFDLTGDMGGQAWISDDDGDQTVAEPRFAQFQASLTSDWVQGWNFTPGAIVVVEIFDLGDVSVLTGSTLADQGGSFHLNELEDLDLIPGMRITVDDGVDAKELVLDELTFETFDFAADTIGGRAVTGTRVDFNVGDEMNNVGGQTTADVDGNWFVDLSTQIDIAASMGGQAWVSDDDGDQTVAEPRFAQFEASLTGDYVEGWNFTPGSTVTVEIFEQSSDVLPLFFGDFTTDPYGNFGVHDLGGLDLRSDMYITVDDVEEDNDKALNLADLTFDEFLASSNRLAGEAPVNALVVFGVGNEFGGIGGEVTAEGSGRWSVNTNTEQFGFFDLLPSMGNGQARVFDDDGDQTVADLRVAQVQASLTGDWVQGGGFVPNSPVTVQVYEELVGQSPGNQLFPPPDPPAPDPISTGDEGSFGLDLGQYGVGLSDGNYIVVTVAGTTKTLLTVALTFDTFDFGTNVIGGMASPGTFVEFGVGNEDGGIGGVVIADESTGEWSVDLFDRYGFDLTDQMGGQAWVSDFDLDQTVAEPAPPEI